MCQTVIMVHTGSHLSLVDASVHISVYHKINTARFVYTDNLYIVMIPVLTLINALSVPEAEYLDYHSIVDIIGV